MFEYRGHCIVSEAAKTYELNFRCLVIHLMAIEVKGLQYGVLVRLSGTQVVRPDGCYEVLMRFHDIQDVKSSAYCRYSSRIGSSP